MTQENWPVTIKVPHKVDGYLGGTVEGYALEGDTSHLIDEDYPQPTFIEQCKSHLYYWRLWVSDFVR